MSSFGGNQVDFSASSGGTFSPSASSFVGNFFTYNGAGAVNFALPSVAALKAYMVAQGITISALGNAVSFSIMNLTAAQTVTITNGGDANWVIISSSGSATVPALSTAANNVLVTTGAAGLLLSSPGGTGLTPVVVPISTTATGPWAAPQPLTVTYYALGDQVTVHMTDVGAAMVAGAPATITAPVPAAFLPSSPAAIFFTQAVIDGAPPVLGSVQITVGTLSISPGFAGVFGGVGFGGWQNLFFTYLRTPLFAKSETKRSPVGGSMVIIPPTKVALAGVTAEIKSPPKDIPAASSPAKSAPIAEVKSVVFHMQAKAVPVPAPAKTAAAPAKSSAKKPAPISTGDTSPVDTDEWAPV